MTTTTKITAKTIANAHIKAYAAAGKVSEQIRQACINNEGHIAAEAYGLLLDEYGKRERVKGTKEFTASTPADTYNTLLQRVTDSLPMGKHKAELVSVELADGSSEERWTLVAVESSGKRAQSKKSLQKLHDAIAEYFAERPHDEKVSEVEQIAKLLGVELPRGTVRNLRKNVPQRQKLDVTTTEHGAKVIKDAGREPARKADRVAVVH
jgi:hypothetical protein